MEHPETVIASAAGRANARPMTGSAKQSIEPPAVIASEAKQSILPLRGKDGLLRFARNDV